MQPEAQAEARQVREVRIFRLVVGALCVSLITFGVLNLMDVIHVI